MRHNQDDDLLPWFRTPPLRTQGHPASMNVALSAADGQVEASNASLLVATGLCCRDAISITMMIGRLLMPLYHDHSSLIHKVSWLFGGGADGCLRILSSFTRASSSNWMRWLHLTACGSDLLKLLSLGLCLGLCDSIDDGVQATSVFYSSRIVALRVDGEASRETGKCCRHCRC